MIKTPLWSFFLNFKSQSNSPIGVDQYFEFLKALHLLPLSEQLKSNADLYRFCKLFWLKKESEEVLFKQCFQEIFNAELFEVLKIESTTLAAPKNKDKTNEVKRRKSPSPNSKKDQEGSNTAKKEETTDGGRGKVTSTKMVDFNIWIDDTGVGFTDQMEMDNYSKHPFNLWDQSIMPFDLRYFAQRLRRRVETSFYERTNQLNIPGMIDEFGQKGYIEKMIYKRRIASNSNVVLLADRYGSMLAYEYWEKQLESAFKSIPNCAFEHYSFYNLPKNKGENKYLFEDANAIGSHISSNKNNWTNKTWFFIFSDAGAHSGRVNYDRMAGSIDFWQYLNEFSTNVHWLNPVPEELQNDCTASRLTFTIPMTYPNKEGLNLITKRSTDG